MSGLTPPWSAETVAALNEYQRRRLMHPFTCPNRGDGRHVRTSDLGMLTATSGGWICPSCGYTQDWAHSFMETLGRRSLSALGPAEG